MQHHLSWRRGVFAFFADRLADPFLELRLGEVVVVDPPFVAGVVGRVDVDALDPSRRGWEASALRASRLSPSMIRLPSSPGFSPFPRTDSLASNSKRVVRDRVVVALNRGLSFELQNRHLLLLLLCELDEASCIGLRNLVIPGIGQILQAMDRIKSIFLYVLAWFRSEIMRPIILRARDYGDKETGRDANKKVAKRERLFPGKASGTYRN